jgi:2,3-bisphosphoglycerate-dependent phosphoglycerate mutase
LGISAIYASDLQRARQTAEIIAEQLGQSVRYDERLRERNVGRWQGLTVEEMQAWYPDEYARLMADRLNYVIPGGESRVQITARMNAAFDQYLTEGVGETIAILSHSSVIRTLLAQWSPQEDYVKQDIGNTSVTTIVRHGDGWRVVASNDVSHLEGLASRNSRELEQQR